MKTYHNFKDNESFQKFLRTKYNACHKGIGCLDYVRVGSVLYTMHEYDMSGKNVTWANKKHERMIEMETSNRYRENGYQDAEVFSYSPSYLRNDINYAE